MKILYFAWLRERIGRSEEVVDAPPEVLTVAGLAEWLSQKGAGYAAAFANPNVIRCAIDQEFVTPDAPVGQAREIAFFPPVTGG
jgi:molybdopterin synthase sulfur carrier subunit